MATRNGARTLGMDDEIGSIQIGYRADLIVIDRDRPHLLPGPDPYSTIAYAARADDVRMTMVNGEILMEAFKPSRFDPVEVARTARTEAHALAGRAAL
jgi:5-methylthioadenosine/S-adenosylhomocysteine deaminase